jgi:polyisoprenoid-binding protein YceI
MQIRARRLTLLGFLAAALVAGCGAQTPAPDPTASSAPSLPPTAQTVPATPDSAAADVVSFRIVSEESEARFLIDEILRGSPNTVVGATSGVSGEILIHPATPGASSLGPITIEAASLTTDSSFRNGAINRFILQTSDFPVITFTARSIDGLPQAVAAGDRPTFSVTGDLTIRDVTLPVTFQVEAHVESDTRLIGVARATVLRTDFGLTIPSVPSVADVSDEVILELEFVAQAS